MFDVKNVLETPVPEKQVRRLKIGDLVYVNGTIITARDEAHRKALKLHEDREPLPVEFGGSCVFHCGPIMINIDGAWKVVAAGPTTSARMEIFQYEFIEAFRPAMIIGKGGMGERTTTACQKFGCVYGAFTGGAAILAAQGLKRVKNVFWLEELGMPECLWVYEAENFGPMTVTIDSHGNNMTEKINRLVSARKERIIGSL